MDDILKHTDLIFKILVSLLTLAGILYKVVKFLGSKIADEYNHFISDREKIDVIFKEITPNHGGSIKDQINDLKRTSFEQMKLTQLMFQQQRWLLEDNDDCIFETDETGLFTWVNKRFVQLCDREVSFFMGKGWKNVIHEYERDDVYSEWQSCVSDGREFEKIVNLVDSTGNIMKAKMTARRTSFGNYNGRIKLL